MITYLLKSGILLFVFYAVYKLLLENEKMFRFNRAYLIGSLIFSFVIPLQLFSIKTTFETGINNIQLEGIVIQKGRAPLNENYIMYTIFYYLIRVYVIVSIVLALRFVLNLISFFIKLKRKEICFVNGVKVVLTNEAVLPHSFWNAIFVNKTDFEMGKIPSELIAHERAHLEQRHTLDVLFVEALQIVFWVNPFFSLLKKAIKLNHEFLADEAVNKQFNSVSDYQNLLLDFASNKNTISLASNINYLITKKRLLMMTKKENSTKIVLKMGFATAICGLILFIFSTKTTAQTNSLKDQNDFKVSYDTTSVNEPQFPGGITEFYKFIGKNFKMPAEASKNKVQGKVLMEFMIEKDGSLSEIKVKKDLGYGLAEEAVRVLRLSPKWIPATENGEPVRVSYGLPITIQSEK
ncbi:M56 family metallopeptidase [Flavobacterium johnsoniae]|nr:M56 family metallopeptidase [Flavobacterium johnsoniae]OXE97720.1 peptidase M56, BlaR1 [Flavobacterium johnsoniae UW101]WQG83811.1 M56 family metallopeptidase [Flavobacterium johnsoniae UW101]SHK21266.1 Signal transducer regulating beta-lactamase production, contains metallopeptidase domain [Flavobacterium johnsoniae]